MRLAFMGKLYQDREIIVKAGDVGYTMHFVQQGHCEVVAQNSSTETVLAILGPGDVFGEMALFTGHKRSATVRAQGQARVLTVDKKTFMRRVHEDPSLAFQILKKLSERIESLNRENSQLKDQLKNTHPVG